MKYLKKFNEELRPSTYNSAARKLLKIGNPSSIEKSNKLKSWAKEQEIKQNKEGWLKSNFEEAKYGTYKMMVEPLKGPKFTGDFYISLDFDENAFEDSYEDEKLEDENNIKSNIFFFANLIPSNLETYNKCEESIPADYIHNGYINSFIIGFDFEITNSKVKFVKTTFEPYDDSEVGDFKFTPSSAQKFKNLLVDIFEGKSDMPSNRQDRGTLHNLLSEVILMENSFSFDYAFKLKDVADYIKTIPKQIFT